MAERAARKVIARAQRTRARVNVRRATSEAILSELLPPYVEEGDSWHVISGGDVDSLSYAKYLIERESFDYMLLSTWCMALEDVRQLSAWLDAGTLRWLDAYTGEIFPNQYADAFGALCNAVRRHKGRVCTFRNHSKVMLLANHALQRFVVIESSANINTNPRTEQTVITADVGLYRFYRDFFDAVHSYNDNFTGWVPHGR